ncbi:non-histone chromosomal MC1 family protein [Halodesulfurarchaeum sp. HSR-GB]|uniref:non-histone chromosomal MC1 family protein n=1 Tax=Halodesulfurarchaeum sp. HSR-GB TaxID=3074077 RepID=UPI002860370F|nr:non-histone chromosomal MC1 family protein [Halodesulfurarchaeum sp. HSR-GB]MDR5657683.1 non-histone chromosomal MC1 family protein [Halodesulfurarchaeum sp. HSR-GB]
MVREDGKRNFVLREDGEESSVFSGNTPRQAAMKAARRLDDQGDSESEAPREELILREKGSDKLHKYEAWAWTEPAPEDSPDWLEGEVSKANVSKQGIEHLD